MRILAYIIPLLLWYSYSNSMDRDTIIKIVKDNINLKYQTKLLKRTTVEEENIKRLIPINQFFPDKYKKLQEAPIKESSDKEMYSHRMEVDLSVKDTPIKNQDNGKCTAFAGTATMENTLGSKLILSSEDTWQKYRVYSCASFINTLTKESNKICDEINYPQYKKRNLQCDKTKHVWIKEYKYLGSNKNEIVRSLNEGRVVYIGMSTPNDMVSCKAVINPNNSFANGGHALVIVGYYTDPSLKDEIVVKIRNSWGSNCGDYGYHYMPLSMINKSGANFAAWEIISVGDKISVVTPTNKCIKWSGFWIWKKCVKWEY